MNKKRYLIIIIILIFLFLTIFSFANPFGNGEGEPNNNRVLEEIEEEDLINKEDQQEETTNVDTPIYNNHGVNVTDKEEEKEEDKEKDNSYELALEAVKKAEVTLDKDNYDNALELVNKVTDSDKKEELEERLVEVLNSINVKELVEKLVKMTKSSTNKVELDAARKFNTFNEIEDKISNLTNEVLKETLEKAVDNIAYLLNDTNVPTINIEDGAILNSDTKIEAEDENELILVLNGTEIENNHVVTYGEYELVVTDAAFNEIKISFTVDTKAPVGTLTYDKTELTNKDVTVTLTTNEDVSVTNNDGKFEYIFTENGEFTFEFVDVAGNKGSATAKVDYIDKVLPEAEVAYNNTKLTNQNVIVKLTLSEEIKEVEGWILSENKMTLTKELEANETGKVTIEDLAGNTNEIEYSVTNMDKEFNTATVTYSTEELTNQNVIVTITLDEEVKEVEGWTLSDDKKVLTKEVEKNETDKITVLDLANNTQEVSYSVTNIDKKAPTVTGVRNNEYYKEATPVVEDENLESIKLNGIEINSGKKILVNGNYTLVATDKAGNTTTVTFTVDSIKPIILVLDFLDVIKTDLIPIKPVIIDANLDTVVVLKDGVDIAYKQGDQLEGEGTYEIFATDKAGNEAYTKFTADNKGPEIKKDGLIPVTIPVIGGVYKEVKIRIDDDNFDEKSIIVLKKSNESIDLPFDYSLPKYKKADYKYGDTLTEQGEYIVLASDNALNISFASFIIDTTAPIVNVENGAFYESLQLNVSDASLLYTEVSKMNSEGYYEITEYKNGDLIEESGKYKVSATDKVLQNTTVEFTIDKEPPKIITSTLPTVVAAEAGKTINVSVTVTDDADLDKTILPKTVTHSNSNLGTITVVDNKIPATEDYAGIYTLVYETTDGAGNPATETVTIEVVRSDVVIKINVPNNVYNGQNKLENITAHLEDKNHNTISTNEGDIEIIAYKLNGNEKEVTYDLTNVGTYKIVASIKEEKVGYEIVPTEIEYKIEKAKINVIFPETVNDNGTIDIKLTNQSNETVTGISITPKFYKLQFDLRNPVVSMPTMIDSGVYVAVVDVVPTENYESNLNNSASKLRKEIEEVPVIGRLASTIMNKLDQYIGDLSEVKLYIK